MKIGEYINKYRNEHGLSTRNFAKLSGLSHSYISMLERNYNYNTKKPIVPSLPSLKQIADATGIILDELLKMLDDETLVLIANEKQNKTRAKTHIPVLGRIPAGIPIEAIEDILDYEDISEDMLKGGKEYFGLKVQGNSMEPKYSNGDILIVQKINMCENGTDAIVMVNGNDATFKRFYKTENGVTLQPLNSEYQPYFYSPEQVENLPVRIIGVPVEIRRKI